MFAVYSNYTLYFMCTRSCKSTKSKKTQMCVLKRLSLFLTNGCSNHGTLGKFYRSSRVHSESEIDAEIRGEKVQKHFTYK